MTLGEFVIQYRDEHKMSIRAFAALVGMSVQQISNIEKGIGNNKKPMSSTMNTYKKIADGIGMSEVDFISLLNAPVAMVADTAEDTVIFPVLGDVKAGYERFSFEDAEEHVAIPREWLKKRPQEDYFVLRVVGDSMNPKYMDGDIVLVLKQSTMDHSGQIGVVLYNDFYATIKRVEYVMGEDWMKLVPINEEFETVEVIGEALEHCRVLGIPKMLIRNIES